MRVAAAHTYLGGFPIGIRDLADIQLVADFESWKLGAAGAMALGLPVVDFNYTGIKQVDMVVANPPCSRFSNFTQAGSFDSDDKAYLSKFCELEQVIDLSKRVKARTIWWETGPLCWNAGRALLRDIHLNLRAHWGQCHTALVLYDTRYAGIPQRRPRCHIIHTAEASSAPPVIAPARWPISLSVKQWVDLIIESVGAVLNLPCHEDGSGLSMKGESPMKYALLCQTIGSYQSARPKITHPDDAYSHSVVSRPMVWDVIDRWMDIGELAALQCYPINDYLDHARKLPSRGYAVALLSKSVSPSASEFLCRNLVLPWLERRTGETDILSVAPVEYDDEMFEYRLTVPDRRRVKA